MERLWPRGIVEGERVYVGALSKTEQGECTQVKALTARTG
jgi:hypothetical protein